MFFPCRVRTEVINQLVSSLQSSALQQSAVVEESSKLLKRYHNFVTNVQHGSTEEQSSLSRDVEVFQTLLKSTRCWVGDLRQTVDLVVQSPVEQRLHCARVRKHCHSLSTYLLNSFTLNHLLDILQ